METTVTKFFLLGVLLFSGCSSGEIRTGQLQTWIWSFNPDRPYPTLSTTAPFDPSKTPSDRELKSIEYLKNKGIQFDEALGHSLHFADNSGSAFQTSQRYRYDIVITHDQRSLMKIEKLFSVFSPLVTKTEAERKTSDLNGTNLGTDKPSVSAKPPQLAVEQ